MKIIVTPSNDRTIYKKDFKSLSHTGYTSSYNSRNESGHQGTVSDTLRASLYYLLMSI